MQLLSRERTEEKTTRQSQFAQKSSLTRSTLDTYMTAQTFVSTLDHTWRLLSAGAAQQEHASAPEADSHHGFGQIVFSIIDVTLNNRRSKYNKRESKYINHHHHHHHHYTNTKYKTTSNRDGFPLGTVTSAA
jgi:hypothetical protein